MCNSQLNTNKRSLLSIWNNYIANLDTSNNNIVNRNIQGRYIDKDSIKAQIKDFISDEINDLQDEGNLCLKMCEDTGDFHLVSYWIKGTYNNVYRFLQDNDSESLLKVVMELYPHNIDGLKIKVKNKYGECTNDRLVYEALASILLNEMQHYHQWYTVYGCEEDDMIDFDRYGISHAITSEEFPVMKISDVTAAMYGLNDTVQPSDMYDIFAHYADSLKIKNKTPGSLFDIDKGEEPIFTPDAFMSAAVVGRYKKYQEFIKKAASDIAFRYTKLIFIDNDSLRNSMILASAIEEYNTRFATAPNGLPMHEDMVKGNIININGIDKFLITYSIRGVKNFSIVWDQIAEIVYDIPKDSRQFVELIIKMSVDFKRELNGLEKVRNQDIAAIDGKYPTRLSATHGLTFVKDMNTHYKDARGNDCRKTPQVRYTLAMAEKQALYITKKALRHGVNNTFISCSFGIDSITTLHILRRVNKHNFNVIFNNSLVEYPQLIKYKRKMTKEWNLEDKLIETRPAESYWDIQKRCGWNFQRKGARNGKGTNNSEECCNKIKHIPFFNKINEMEKQGKPMELDFSGLRAMESRSREQSTKRDNLVYLAKVWKCIRVNPIAFFSDEMVWEYVKKYNIPYCEIYDMKVYYEDVYDNVSEEEEGKVYYSPRCGCSTCLINTSRGYLFFLRKYYLKLYKYMMYDMGLVVTLFERGGKKIGILSSNEEKSKAGGMQLSIFDVFSEDDNFTNTKSNTITNEDILENYPLDMMENMIMRRPCKFLT